MMAMDVGRIMLLFFVSSWMIIHFGINPDSGGKPPRDNMVIRMSEVTRGVLFHMWDSDSVVVEELSINSINVVSVIVM